MAETQAAETGVKDTQQTTSPVVDSGNDDFDMDGYDIFDGIVATPAGGSDDVTESLKAGINNEENGQGKNPPATETTETAAIETPGKEGADEGGKKAASAGVTDDSDGTSESDDNSPDDEDDNGSSGVAASIDPESIMKKLDELERVNKGLLGTISAEREKRQSVESRLQQVDAYLTQIQESRNLSAQQKEDLTAQAEAELDALQLEFDEDDNPVIPMDKLLSRIEERIVGRLEQKITPIQQELLNTKTQTAAQAAQTQMQQAVDTVISENEAYPDAMNKLVEEWNWINDKFGAHVAMTGKNPQSIPEMYEMMYSAGLDQMFQDQFPGSDMDLVVDAFTNQSPVVVSRKLKKALDLHTSESGGGNGNSNDKTTLANQRAGTKQAFRKTKKLAGNNPFMNIPSENKVASALDDVVAMDPEDFMSISDTDVERIKRLLRKGE